jgi:2-polyprenyl-3-methyl-5-hydroxy-6-metoxy-1,4-benzoquinol methylase
MKPFLAPYIQKARLREIQPFLSGRILDLGCGFGGLIPLLSSGQDYAGVDISSDIIYKMLHTHPKKLFVVCDLDHEDLHLNQYFDTVVMSALIEHIADPDQLIRSIKRHLKKNGKLVLTTPTPFGNRVHWWGAHFGLFYIEAALDHKIIYNQKKLFQLFLENEFSYNFYKIFLLGCNQIFVTTRN